MKKAKYLQVTILMTILVCCLSNVTYCQELTLTGKLTNTYYFITTFSRDNTDMRYANSGAFFECEHNAGYYYFYKWPWFWSERDKLESNPYVMLSNIVSEFPFYVSTYPETQPAPADEYNPVLSTKEEIFAPSCNDKGTTGLIVINGVIVNRNDLSLKYDIVDKNNILFSYKDTYYHVVYDNWNSGYYGVNFVRTDDSKMYDNKYCAECKATVYKILNKTTNSEYYNPKVYMLGSRFKLTQQYDTVKLNKMQINLYNKHTQGMSSDIPLEKRKYPESLYSSVPIVVTGGTIGGRPAFNPATKSVTVEYGTIVDYGLNAGGYESTGSKCTPSPLIIPETSDYSCVQGGSAGWDIVWTVTQDYGISGTVATPTPTPAPTYVI